MEYSKIKNIIIVILLALNMFFLVLFLIGRWESGKLERKAKDDIVSLFSEAGISVEASAIPSDSTIGYYKMNRELESEKFIADTLLGTKDMTATGAGTYQYLNLLFGEALFYPQGDFSVTLKSGKELKDTSDAAIIKFLSDINIDARIDRIEQETSEDRKTVYLTCVFNKVRIMNARLVMVLDGNTLLSLTGKRPGTSPVYADVKIMGVKTALIKFLDQIKSLDPYCKSIRFVSAGYLISDDGTGGTVLLPVWRVETNSGNYYVNGINGKISEFFD